MRNMARIEEVVLLEMWYLLMQHQFSWDQNMGSILLKLQWVHNANMCLLQFQGVVYFPCSGDQFKDWIPWDILHYSVCDWSEFGWVQKCKRENCSHCSRCESFGCNGWTQWWWSVWNQHYASTFKCFSKHPILTCCAVSTSAATSSISSGINGKLPENIIFV